MSDPRAEARKLHKSGLGYKRIAEHLGITRDRARALVNPDRLRFDPAGCKCGGPKSRGARECRKCRVECGRTTKESAVHEMIALRKQGLLNPDIAKIMGFSVPHIADELSRAKAQGIAIPPSPYLPRALNADPQGR